MDEYCTCAFQGTDQALFDADLVHCSTCHKLVCCDVAVLEDDTVERHSAEIADGEHFLCWSHLFLRHSYVTLRDQRN